MLRYALEVGVAFGKEFLEVFLEIVLDTQLCAGFDHAEGVVIPICGFGHGEIIGAANFV